MGRRIRELRGFDMTQAEFGAALGISQNYVSMMESGRVEIGGGDSAAHRAEIREEYRVVLVGEDR